MASQFVVSADFDANPIETGARRAISVANEMEAAWNRAAAVVDIYINKLTQLVTLQQSIRPVDLSGLSLSNSAASISSTAQISANAAQVERDIARIPTAAEAAWNRIVDIETKAAAVRQEVQKNFVNLTADEQKRLTGEILKELDRRAKEDENVAKKSSQENARITAQAARDSAKQITEANRQAAEDSALSFNTIFGASFFASLVADAVKTFTVGFIEGLSSMTQFAARTEQLGVALEGLAKANGLSVASIREQEQALRDANIATQSARQVLTQYIAAGLPLQKASPLATVAKDLAVIAGANSSEELERLIQGITTLNLRVLRTAGVYISLKDAYKQYADEHKMHVSDLDTETKQQIALNEVLKFGARANGLYQDSLGTAAKQMSSLTRIQQDFSDQVGGKLTPIMYGLIVAWSTILKVAANSPGAFLLAASALAVLTVAIIAFNTAQIAALPVISQVIGGIMRLVSTMFLMQSVMNSTAATVAVATGGWLAVLAIIGAIGYAIYNYAHAQKETIKVTEESVQTLIDQQKATSDTLSALEGLKQSNVDHAKKMDVINEAYQTLNAESRLRVETAQSEQSETARLQQKVAALADEYKRLNEEKQKGIQTQADINANTLVTLTNEYKTIKDQTDKIQEERNKLIQQNLELAKLPANTVLSTKTVHTGEGIYTENFTVGNQISQNRAELDKLGKSWEDLTDKQGDGVRSLKTVGDEFQNAYKTQQLAAGQMGVTIESTIRQTLANRGLSKEADNTVTSFNWLTGELHIFQNQTDKTTSSIEDQAKALKAVRSELQALSLPSQITIEKTVLDIVKNAKNAADAKKQAQNLLTSNDEVKSAVEQNKLYKETEKAARSILDPAEKTAKAHRDSASAVSQLKRETNELTKAERELTALRTGGGKLYEIRVQREAIDDEKQKLEEILKLRRELNQDDRAALPQNFADAKAELEYLERIKKLRDDVLKIQREGIEAEDKLLVARLTANAEVVSAQVRSDQAYFDSSRSRKNAEQQLTADIVSEIRRREFAQTESVRNAWKAQSEAYKDFLSEQTNRDYDRQKALAKLSLEMGLTLNNNGIISAAEKLANAPKPDVSPVVGEIKTSNDLLTKILQAVQKPGDGASATAFSGNKVWDWKSLKAWGEQNDLIFAHGKDGTHNKGSKHYDGLAIDTEPVGGFKDVAGYVDKMAAAIVSGIRVVDERIRPKKGAKWKGAHLHLEENDDTPSFFNPKLDYDGRLEWLKELDRQRLARAKGISQTNAQTSTQQSTPENVPSNAQRPRIAGLTPIDPNIKSLRDQFFEGFKLDSREPGSNPILSDDSFKSLTEYYLLLDKFTRKEGEAQSAGEREAVGQAKLARFRNVQIEQIKDLAIAEEKINALRTGDDVAKAEVLQAADIARKQQVGNVLAENIALTEKLNLLRSGDKVLKAEILEAADVDRKRNLAGILNENIVLEERLSKGGRDWEQEAAQLSNERLKTLLSVGDAEANLERQRALNSDAEVRRARQESSVINERADLENRLAQIEDQRATSGANQALRVRVAIEEELLAIHQADLKAQEDIARAEVRLNDMRVLHSDQAKAKILDHLAQQKSRTEATADGIIKAYERVAGFFDDKIDKTIGKVPILGDIFGEIFKSDIRSNLSDITRSLLDKFFPGLSDKLNQTNNPVAKPIVEKINKTNELLQKVVDNTAPAGSIPTSASGIASTIEHLITGNHSSSGPASGGGSGGNILSSIVGGIFKLFGVGSTGSIGGTGTKGYGGGMDSNGVFHLSSGGQSSASLQTIIPAKLSEVTQAIAEKVNQSSIDSPTPITEAPQHGAVSRTVDGVTHQVAGSVLSGGSFGSIAKSLGQMAPMLGLSLGSSLGGQSMFGSILGGLGGLAGGLALGIGTGAIGATGGIMGGLIGALGGAAAATGILAAVAAPLLIGAWILGRNAKRKAEEKVHDSTLGDVFSQIDNLIKQVNQDKLDGQSAVAQANGLKDQYIQKMNQLTDKKTRSHALQDVSRIDTRIASLQHASEAQDQRKDVAKQWTAQYNTGGYIRGFADGGTAHPMFTAQMGYSSFTSSLPRNFSGHIPGTFDRKDDVHLAVSRGEHVIVMTPQQWALAGRHIEPHLREANVPGFKTGGGYNAPQTSSSSRYDNPDDPLEITVEELRIDMDEEKIFLKGAQTNKGRKVMFRAVKMVLNGKANS